MFDAISLLWYQNTEQLTTMIVVRIYYRCYCKPQVVLRTCLVTVFIAIALSSGCRLFRHREPLECSLVELQRNDQSRYFDAAIRVDRMALKDAEKSLFLVTTATQSLDLSGLNFSEDGQDSAKLEKGDIFVVPLRKPDWSIRLSSQNTILATLNFWDSLPEGERWHPLKSEAAQVAESIKAVSERGDLKPRPSLLPPEWKLAEEKPPDADDPSGYLLYQKVRGEMIKEQVDIQYSYLAEEEKMQLEASPVTEFLKGWSEWTEKYGKPANVIGHEALALDLPGTGEFGWIYRYIYVDREMVIEVQLEADPLEWGKSEREKEEERRTDSIFLLHGYDIAGEPGAQGLIEIRWNREGAFRKRSKDGTTAEKAFQLTDDEFAKIESVLRENRFRELESRSGPPGGISSFVSVHFEDMTHTVEIKNFELPYYRNIIQTIRQIVLPRVDEKLPRR
jgi:hypothetical protein